MRTRRMLESRVRAVVRLSVRFARMSARSPSLAESVLFIPIVVPANPSFEHPGNIWAMTVTEPLTPTMALVLSLVGCRTQTVVTVEERAAVEPVAGESRYPPTPVAGAGVGMVVTAGP